jgi:hypothetical protein
MLCCVEMLCYVMVRYVVLCYVNLGYVVLCYVMLCYVMLYLQSNVLAFPDLDRACEHFPIDDDGDVLTTARCVSIVLWYVAIDDGCDFLANIHKLWRWLQGFVTGMLQQFYKSGKQRAEREEQDLSIKSFEVRWSTVYTPRYNA